jgi:hypothetical protein
VEEKSPPKSAGFIAQYQRVLNARQSEFDRYFNNAEISSLHEIAHIRMLDVEQVLAPASNRRESRLFALAAKLLAEGLCNVACANYQLAFFCLRSFLELSTAAIKFSAVEFELRQWERGDRDIVWNSASVGESGVYSKPFAAAFFPGLAEEYKHYAGLASRVYRECSEYVHANLNSHVGHAFDERRIKHWFSLFDAATTCTIYGFFVRYNSEFDLSENAAPEVNAILSTDLGHFPGVIDALSGVAG